ncbi:polymer-forming cytoskeletal protein (plasmid) [Escherichia coli]|nr:polymer-forming cytoskeletal protein [Escherichia coli]
MRAYCPHYQLMLFWIASLCWLSLILLWGTGSYPFILYIIFTFTTITLYALYFIGENMFPKGRKNENASAITIISKSASFIGDISSSEKIIIHGEINGNISANNGVVFIDKGGVVNGSVLCEKLILNGELHGECCCSVLDVYENGFLQGDVSYRELEIRNGGCIIGVVNKVTDEIQNNISELEKKER